MRIIKRKKIVDENVKIDFLTELIATFFYTGYLPVASGTLGSIAGGAVLLLHDVRNPIWLTGLILLFFVLGVVTSRKMMTKYGNDPSVVVVDEVVGIWITALIYIIFSGNDLSLFYLLVCFFFFRFFDIAKFQPAKYFDRVHTGLGIMLDDVIAGIYAGLAVYFFSLSGFNPF